MAKFISTPKLSTYLQADISDRLSVRPGETKLGECIKILTNTEELNSASVDFVLLGLPEDIGIRANFGIGGAYTTWEQALKAFLNIQSTTKLNGAEVGLLGYVNFEQEMTWANSYDLKTPHGIKQIRALVSKIDTVIADILFQIFQSNKIPILIGGGHNNCYPILKALAKHHKQAVSTINIDAHADFRPMEGRHSGNGFKYAMHEGYLSHYAVIGLHQNYNAQPMLNELEAKPEQIFYTFLEDYIHNTASCEHDFIKAQQFTKSICGLELDLDCIAGILSSAGSLTGFSVNQVRQMIALTQYKKIAYLHITEGVYKMNDGREEAGIGKLIATFITDFIKAQV